MLLPVLHAGGFSWDEALVLGVAILAVPAISFFASRLGKRRAGEAPAERRRERAAATPDDAAPDDAAPESGQR